MMKVAALLLFGLVVVSAYTEQEYRDTFTAWLQKHGKVYANAEFQSRYNVFKKNMDYVRDWNANTQNTVVRMSSSHH